jgi:hypothetical protein
MSQRHSTPLTTLANEQIITELSWSRKIINDVLGVTPNSMHPLFGDINDRVRVISLAMGLRLIMRTCINLLQHSTLEYDQGFQSTPAKHVRDRFTGPMSISGVPIHVISFSLFVSPIPRGCAAAQPGTRDCQDPDRTPEVPPTTQIWTEPNKYKHEAKRNKPCILVESRFLPCTSS